MIASLKSEIRKLYTLRSTYVILLISLIAMGIFAFWVEGIKAGVNGSPISNPYKLASLMRDAITNLAFWGSIVAILTATHEYRYNTIMYTLTASRSRSQSLAAKLVAVSIYAILFTLFIAVMSAAFMYVGLAIKGLSLTHQIIPGDLWWRILFEGWGSCMIGLLLGMLIRQQVGAISAFFVLPIIVEPILSLLLKNNQIYLPFIALQQVTKLGGVNPNLHALSHSKAALVFCTYLVIGWIVAWVLFLRRDAA